MNVQIVLIGIVGLYALSMLLASLAGVFKPKVRDVFVVSCMILLWVLIAAKKVERLSNSLQQTQGASGVAK